MLNYKQGTIIGIALGLVQLVIVSLILSRYVTLDEWYMYTPLVALIIIPFYLGKLLDEWVEKAEIDPLTKALNRRCLTANFQRYANIAIRQNQKCVVFVVDVNDFKIINDKKGHLFGDKVLTEIACALKSSLRASDLIVRWGGDEFIILSHISNPNNIEEVCARIKKEMIAVSSRLNIKVDVSIGHSVFPDQGNKLGKLIQLADANMYSKKQCRFTIVEKSRQEA
jgi:diguanylate cyclase (GGDEF)-like protein